MYSRKRVFDLTPPVEKIQPTVNFVYNGNYLFFTCSRLVGACSVLKDAQGNFKLRFSSFCFIYSASIAVALLFLSANTLFISGTNLATKQFSFQDALMYGCFSAAGFTQLIPVIALLEGKKLAAYLNHWTKFQIRFEQITETKLEFRRLLGFFLYASFNLSFLITLITTKDDLLDTLCTKYDLSRTDHEIIAVTGFTSVSTIATYIYYIILFTDALCIAADRFITNFERDTRLDAFKVRRYMHLWIDLSDLCQQLGEVLAWTYLYLFSVMFLISLPSLYIASIMLKNGEYSQLFSPICTIMCLSSIAEIGNRASSKVGNSVTSALKRVLTSGHADNCQREIEQFLVIIASMPPDVSIGGFFTLNRSMIVPLWSSVATYFIIILQFGTDKSRD